MNREPAPTSERILYVDDERVAREAFATAARAIGFRVDTADGGGEALTKASQNRYAVIAADLRMPTLNGLSLIQLLRPKWPRASYLIVTGASHLELPSQHDGEPLVDEILEKPWRLEELARILSRAIERYRARSGDASPLSREDLPILLVAEGASAGVLEEAVRGAFPASHVELAPTTAIARGKLIEDSFLAAFVNLDLAESRGLSSIAALRAERSDLPLLAVGPLDDEQARRRAIDAGAQDYLAVGALTGYLLRQAIRYALERVRAEERISFLDERDPVSGLYNRRLFLRQMERAVARGGGTAVALLILDLDRFKTVNDSLGYEVGDRLLKAVAERLLENVGQSAVAARLGGDEFAVLLPRCRGQAEAVATAQRLMESLVPPIALDEYEIAITASLGIALHPDHAESAAELLKRADRAMYRAKESGRDACELASDDNEESRSGALERLSFESGVRHALVRDEYVVYYQPQMTMDRSRLLAVEALIRWNHPKVGLVPPGKFMPFLESTGLIKGVGAWILETACGEIREWQRRGFADLRITVNLSARQFEGTDLVAAVERILSSTGLPPSSLELEITESLLMRDTDRTRAILEELKFLGVRIAIDDFGTGYSSLAYLTKFPLDCLKIDRSFVRDIETDASDRAVAQAIIGLGHTLRLDVVAEGVETEPQLELLKGCDGFQGYLIAKPQSGPATFALLERYRNFVS